MAGLSRLAQQLDGARGLARLAQVVEMRARVTEAEADEIVGILAPIVRAFLGE